MYPTKNASAITATESETCCGHSSLSGFTIMTATKRAESAVKTNLSRKTGMLVLDHPFDSSYVRSSP